MFNYACERFLQPSDIRRYVEDIDDKTAAGSRDDATVKDQLLHRLVVLRPFWPDTDLSFVVLRATTQSDQFDNSFHLVFFNVRSNSERNIIVNANVREALQCRWPTGPNEKPWAQRMVGPMSAHHDLTACAFVPGQDSDIHTKSLRLPGCRKTG